MVSSFWPDTLQALGAALAGSRVAPVVAATALSLLVHPRLDPDGPVGLDLAVAEGWAAINPHCSAVTGDLVRRAHGAGIAVWIWTVTTAAEAAAAAVAGVDGVIADHVALARSGLGR